MGLKAYADHWGLVTGASSGIGAEFARQLAARGMHLVLTARRDDRLRALAEELHTAHGTQTEIITADLSKPEEPARLANVIAERGRTIELLINNAGLGTVSEIQSADLQRIRDVLQVNVMALTELCYRFLPGMIERGHGGVINLASVAAFQAVGYMGVYSASKTYVLHLSESLWAEARLSNVTVLAMCPGTTSTEFFDVAGRPGWAEKHGAAEVKPVVRTALQALDRGRPVAVAGVKNYMNTLLVRLAPRWVAVRASMSFFRPEKKP